jgi:hypothetical protein
MSMLFTMHHSNYNRDKSHIAYVTEKYYGSITKIEILKHNDKIERKPHWSTYIYVAKFMNNHNRFRQSMVNLIGINIADYI